MRVNTQHLEQYLKIADSKSLDILFWLLQTRDKDNIIFTTLDNVSFKCNVTKVTVNRVFQRLYKEGFLTKLRNGQYQLHKV